MKSHIETMKSHIETPPGQVQQNGIMLHAYNTLKARHLASMTTSGRKLSGINAIGRADWSVGQGQDVRDNKGVRGEEDRGSVLTGRGRGRGVRPLVAETPSLARPMTGLDLRVPLPGCPSRRAGRTGRVRGRTGNPGVPKFLGILRDRVAGRSVSQLR